MGISEYSNLFKALGDLNRLQIITLLQEGEKCAGDILETVKVSQSTLSHHLKQLTDADLLVATRRKKTIYYSINDETFSICRQVLGNLMSAPVAGTRENETESGFDRVMAKAFRKTTKYMCLVDILNDAYQLIDIAGGELLYSESMPNAAQNLRSSMEFIAGGEEKERGRDFVDLNTLDARMNESEEKDMLNFAFESPSVGWVNAGFVAVDYDSDGMLSRVLYLLQDISQEKKIEKNYREQLVQMLEQAKSEDLSQREFLSRLSFRFRNPLNGIMGAVDVMRRAVHNQDRVMDCANKIEQSSLNLLALIEDMSAMSEIESGKLLFVEEPNSIWELIRDVSAVVKADAERAGVTFAKKKGGKIVHPDIICSGGHLRYLLRTLLCNVIENCEAGDTVLFEFKEQDMFGDRASFLITIESDAKGEKREEVPPICNQIVEKTGGVIRVEKERSGGSRIAMILPFVVDETEKVSGGEQQRGQTENKNILVVEDDELNLEITRFLLEDAGFHVTTAADGQEALDLFEQSGERELDIILMDITMPKMDGLTAARRIRESGRADAETVPIVAMSANVMSDDVQKSLQAGMNAHVGKPLRTAKLLSVIAEYTEKEEKAE